MIIIDQSKQNVSALRGALKVRECDTEQGRAYRQLRPRFYWHAANFLDAEKANKQACSN